MNPEQTYTADDVKAANKTLYDKMAANYEELDGRRSASLSTWLQNRLSDIRKNAPGGCLLDLGAGSGFVSRCAIGIFDHRIGMDISENILNENKDAFDEIVVGDIDSLPFPDESIDAVVCFAVLHHLFSFEQMIKEVCRVLKPNGIFYSDHDIDLKFVKRFKKPLAWYRAIADTKEIKRAATFNIKAQDIQVSEWQSSGVDASLLSNLLCDSGFLVDLNFHWYGLTPMTDFVFSNKNYTRGWAPLISVNAFKT